MNESERLAEQLTRALNGEAWHGPSWRRCSTASDTGRPRIARSPRAHHRRGSAPRDHLERRRAAAARRRVARGHGVGGLAARGISGQRRRVVGGADHFFESGRSLADTVARFPTDKLVEKRPGVDGTWYELVVGQLQHLLYHAGQAGLLRRRAFTRRSEAARRRSLRDHGLQVDCPLDRCGRGP